MRDKLVIVWPFYCPRNPIFSRITGTMKTKFPFLHLAVLATLLLSSRALAQDSGDKACEQGGQKSQYAILFKDDFSAGSKHWQPTDADAWGIVEQGSNKIYSLHQQSKYEPPFRSPYNISLVKNHTVGSFDMQTRVITTARDYGHRSMCLFFGYQDPSHFYYVHLGQETDDRANQIFIVNNAARTKISTKTTLGTPWDDQWHAIRILRDIDSGTIKIYWDDMSEPIMTAVDKTFTWGSVGLGSFDDTGNWDDFKLFGTPVKKPKS